MIFVQNWTSFNCANVKFENYPKIASPPADSSSSKNYYKAFHCLRIVLIDCSRDSHLVGDDLTIL